MNESAHAGINLPAEGITLMLRPDCKWHNYSMLIHNVNHSLPGGELQSYEFDCKSGFERFKPFNSNFTKKLHINISMLNESFFYKNTHNFSMNVSLEIYTTGCFYWNRYDHSWRSDGCKVGQHIACYVYLGLSGLLKHLNFVDYVVTEN